MFHTPIWPRTKKRPKSGKEEEEEEVAGPGRAEVKFRDVRLYLVEMKMGHSRRSFLSQLARSKGFIVDDVLRLGEPFFFISFGQERKKK